MFEKYPDVMTVSEIAEALRVGKSYAYQLISSGRLKNIGTQNKFRVTKACLIDFVSGKWDNNLSERVGLDSQEEK